MALSSIEAKYHAPTHTATKVAWMKTLFVELGLEVLTPPIIWCDNQSVLALSSNPMLYAHIKHIEIDAYYIKDEVTVKHVIVQYVFTDHQKANILTKALLAHKFEYFRDVLNVFSIAQSHLIV